ncbi:MAG: peptide ABC transporter permease, partial [Bradyrhizobium sp.]|nr:peptide ABC transporter permease [Bradyrhizobium sp.]
MTDIAAHLPPIRWWHSRGVRRFMRHHLALLGFAMIALLVLACVLGPYALPYDSLHIDMRARFAPPLSGH